MRPEPSERAMSLPGVVRRKPCRLEEDFAFFIAPDSVRLLGLVVWPLKRVGLRHTRRSSAHDEVSAIELILEARVHRGPA
jgi:hypothetical protein